MSELERKLLMAIAKWIVRGWSAGAFGVTPEGAAETREVYVRMRDVEDAPRG